MKLFNKIESSFSKEAALYPLSDNDAMWGSEILAALYKQHSYLGKYEVNMVVEQQDNSLGYMYGSFTVKNPNSTPPPAQAHGRITKNEAPEAQTAKIPVIVESGKVYSFDVFIDPAGNYLPLSEERLESSLFDHNNYTAVPMKDSRPYPDDGDGMQPQVPNTGLGYGSAGRNTVFKGASLMTRILPTIPNKEKTTFVEKALADPWVGKVCLEKNAAFKASLEQISSHREFNKTASAKSVDDVDYVVVEKVPGGYEFTTTQGGEKTVLASFSNSEAASLGKPELLAEALEKGAALYTINPTDVSEFELADDHLDTVEEAGVYALMSKTGEALRGVVLSDVRNLRGDKTGLKLVMTKEGAALQDEVVGTKVDTIDFDLIAGQPPRGEGVFMFKEGSVTEPIRIMNTLTVNGQDSYVFEDSWGKQGILKEGACLRPLSAGGSHYLIPSGSKFVPVTFGGGTLVDRLSISKMASAADIHNRVTIHRDGGDYLLSGEPVGMSKTASYTEALHILGALGVPGPVATKKLAAATEDEGAHLVVEPREEVEKVASADVDFGEYAEIIRLDLTKVAAELKSDQETIDSVLSLNFVTPENITGYIEAIPEYEQCLSRLSELLIGARLGLPDVKEPVVLTAMRSIDRVVKTLKKLELRANHDQQ